MFHEWILVKNTELHEQLELVLRPYVQQTDPYVSYCNSYLSVLFLRTKYLHIGVKRTRDRRTLSNVFLGLQFSHQFFYLFFQSIMLSSDS